MRYAVLLATPLALLLGLDRPAALIAVLGLGALAAVVTRVGLWLLDEPSPDPRALRAGAGTAVAATGVGASAMLLGPATVVLVVVATVVSAAVLWPGRTPGVAPSDRVRSHTLGSDTPHT